MRSPRGGVYSRPCCSVVKRGSRPGGRIAASSNRRIVRQSNCPVGSRHRQSCGRISSVAKLVKTFAEQMEAVVSPPAATWIYSWPDHPAVQRSRHFANAMTDASGLPAAPATRTKSPVAIPSGGLCTTRSSGDRPEPISTSFPRSRDRNLFQRDAADRYARIVQGLAAILEDR
jgi:hypothetical protein